MDNANKYWKGRGTPFRCIDLFCGAGGLSLGFCQAGGVPVAAVDIDRDSIETYRKMFPFCEQIFCGPIEDWHPRTAALGDIDVVIGGPPCQGFSLARGTRFVDDPRNRLYKEFVRFVSQLRPKWFVMENVPGITNIGGGSILKAIYDDFDRIGYNLDHKVVNMAEYGVPQSRRRAIFVGNRVGANFSWPVASHTMKACKSSSAQLELLSDAIPVVSIADALGDLPWPLGRYFAHRANSQMRGPRNRIVESDPAFTLRVRGDEFAFCSEPASGAFIPGPLPEVKIGYSPVETEYQRLMRESSPPWLEFELEVQETRRRRVGSLRGTRRLAILEQQRLQGFPDWFQFVGRSYAQGKQIGNAVPPVFASRLFREILKINTKISKIERSRDSLSTKQDRFLQRVA